MKWTHLMMLILRTISATNFMLKIETRDTVKTHPNFNSIMFRYLDEVDTLDDVDIEDEVDTELEVDTLKIKENCYFKSY